MPDVPYSIPFRAYTGQEPYIFASYAHANGEEVFRELTHLNSLGFRVWYDEGIDPGNEWPEDIAKALSSCSLFLVFVTPRSLESRNVRNEIYFALNHDKPFLAIYLEPSELPPGLELRMGDIQAVMRYRMSENHYRTKINAVLPSTLKANRRARIEAAYNSYLVRVIVKDDVVGTPIAGARVELSVVSATKGLRKRNPNIAKLLDEHPDECEVFGFTDPQGSLVFGIQNLTIAEAYHYLISGTASGYDWAHESLDILRTPLPTEIRERPEATLVFLSEELAALPGIEEDAAVELRLSKKS